MRAQVGEHIVMRGKTVETPDRHGVILEVRGEEGAAPYFVRFDDGHEALVFPGGDSIIQHHTPDH